MDLSAEDPRISDLFDQIERRYSSSGVHPSSFTRQCGPTWMLAGNSASPSTGIEAALPVLGPSSAGRRRSVRLSRQPPLTGDPPARPGLN